MKKYEEKGNFMKKKIFFGLFLIMGGITNCVSIQELINSGKMPAVDGYYLDLTNQNITSLEGTENIPGHENIRTLDLTNNKLRSIPGKIKGLENLENLYLITNKLSSIPGKIKGLKNLKYLNLDDNKITTMPVRIEGLENLEGLYITENKLQNMPKDLKGYKNLKILIIINNPPIDKVDIRTKGLQKLDQFEMGSKPDEKGLYIG